MPIYQIDKWTGEFHQHHVERTFTEDWDEAQAYMKDAADQGGLCNVLVKPETYIPETERTN